MFETRSLTMANFPIRVSETQSLKRLNVPFECVGRGLLKSLNSRFECMVRSLLKGVRCSVVSSMQNRFAAKAVSKCCRRVFRAVVHEMNQNEFREPNDDS